MKRVLIGVMTVGLFALLMGCNNKSDEQTKDADAVVAKQEYTRIIRNGNTIDYADYPDNFMIRLEAGQEYVLQEGDKSINFCAQTKEDKSKVFLRYGEHIEDLSSEVYFRRTEPILIRCNGHDYIWICEENDDGTLIGAACYYITEYNSMGCDSITIDMKLGEEVPDPTDFVMSEAVNCFGPATTSVHYRIDECGKPEELANDDEYYYIEAPYKDELLRLENDIHTWVYADAEAKKSSVTDIPAGTTFRRLRVPKDSENNYVEGILDDGRVIRVVEEYWFSEPTAYQAMMDKDKNQFKYTVVCIRGDGVVYAK